MLLKKLKDKKFQKELSNKYSYILIDDFQDTSNYQFYYQRLLTNKSNFCGR